MLFSLIQLRPTHLYHLRKTDISFHTHLFLNTLAAEDVAEAEEVAVAASVDVAVDAEVVAVAGVAA